jgi:arylsulfatase A-like enzyme
MGTRRNILLVFPDQWRGDCLGSAGFPGLETPYLDELAAAGTRFSAAYSACPSCIAARANLMTGMSPLETGRTGYRDGVRWTYPNTLAQTLRDSGYQTMLAGKTHFHPQRLRLGFEDLQLYDTQTRDPGFESDYARWLRRETADRIVDTTMEMSTNSWTVRVWPHEERLHPNCWTADQAIELLERRDPTRPFFLQVGFHRPHPPFDPPAEYFERYLDKELPPPDVGDWVEIRHPMVDTTGSAGILPPDALDRSRRAYLAQLSHLDFQIGKIVYRLHRMGLFENTTIIFSSDHGEMLGDHHMTRKSSALEGSAHVPLIVRPARSSALPRGTVCDSPATLADIMPTILREADIPIPETVSGLALQDAVQHTGQDWREFVHICHAPSVQAVTNGQEKFMWDTVSGKQWFFDLRTDPGETRNLIDKPRAAAWRQRLVATLSGSCLASLVEGGELRSGQAFPAVVDDLIPPEL